MKGVKEYYKINEISKLYGIGIDSLRYYERLGILQPRRDTNGYRLYSLKEIYKLNIIRDLRTLDFSMKQIKEYLDHQSIGNTLDLLNKEQEFIHGQIATLRKREMILQKRIEDLHAAASIVPGGFSVLTLPQRPCVRLNETITRDEEMDLLIKRIHSRYESKILDLGTQSIGASIAREDIEAGKRNVYYSVFFILEQAVEECDFLIPHGVYISCFYRGGYLQNLDRIQEAFTYAAENGYEVIGDPFELYRVDNRDTVDEKEFLTEIQVPVQLA